MNRYDAAGKAGIFGIVGNIFLAIIKGIVGFLTNSQAMIADFFNSFGDVFSSLMTFIGNQIASREADEDHNLGHGKAEYVYSFLISIAMLITAFLVIRGAISTYINDSKIEFSLFLVFVCGITIITKFILYLYTKSLYKKHQNILLKANSKDHRNDIFVTSLTLISSVLGIYGYRIVDLVVAIIIALWIAYTAMKLFKESYDVLMDKCINEETKDKIMDLIHRHDEVLRVIHFNSTPVGYRYQISFTIFVDGNLSTFESHEIANTLEREIEKEIPEVYLTIIHVNPMNVK